MIFNLKSKLDQQRFKERCKHLYQKEAKVELLQKRKKRTLSQNNYLHLILTWYGLELGYTLAEAKKIFKEEINRDSYEYEKNGKIFYKSTANRNTKELTIDIERFRNHSSSYHGIYLPEPDEKEKLESMQDIIRVYGNKQYT